MKKLPLAAGALAVLLGLAGAAPLALSQVASQDPQAVKPGAYKVEPYHTQVAFTVSHFGFTEFSGFFSGASGTLRLDPANPSGSTLQVSIPVQSVTTTVAKLDDELKGQQWLDAAQFPAATFTSTKITQTGRGAATIAGDLTLHGVTRPITLEAHLVGAGVNPLSKAVTVGFAATGVVRRSEFGVKTYVPLVGDDVRLTIAGAFELQP